MSPSIRLCALTLGLGVVALVFGRTLAETLEVNGKSTPGAVLEQGGKTYVLLDALQAAGAQVNRSTGLVSVQFLPVPGRDQIDAEEGKLEYWIQNELWRVRVESVEPGTNPFGRGPGLFAKVEFRNLSGRAISPFASGMDKLQVIDDRGQILHFNQGTFKQYFKDIAPGGSAVETIGFGSQDGAIKEVGKPAKLMIFFRSSGGKKAKDIRIFLESE